MHVGHCLTEYCADARSTAGSARPVVILIALICESNNA